MVLTSHPLYRALRTDKLALAALEATLAAYSRDSQFDELPTLRMIALSQDEIRGRAEALLEGIRQNRSAAGLAVELIDGESAIGGGSAPTTNPKTVLIALSHSALSSEAIEEALRQSNPPVIARIAEGKVLLDLRTVAEEEEPELVRALAAID